jgi:SAM-dependent methyltransferase
MTIWDNIYKKFLAGGDAWATLSEEIHPLFIEFLENSNFKEKSVFDIGVGTGKYLKFLEENGFNIAGIDSSKTAINMAKQNLKNPNSIYNADMFEYTIPPNKFDLIISISTIHHGYKTQIETLINKIYDALLNKGKIFITLPNYESAIKFNYLENNQPLNNNTFAPKSGPEKGLAHSYYSKTEIIQLFSKFKNLQINLDSIGRFVIRAEK